MAIYANLSIDQGSDFSEELKVEDETSQPVNLNGYIVAGEIRKHYTSETKYDFNCTITSEVQGLITIKLPASVSNAMKPGRYQYDIEIKKVSTSVITRVVEGQIEVTGGITRSI